MTIPAATTAVHYSAATGDPKQARAELYAHQQAFEKVRSFVGGEMGSLTATDAGTLNIDSVDAGTIYVAAQAGSPSPVISDLGTPTRGAPWKTLVFEAGITLQHGAGSLELPGGANILTEDGDSAVAIYDTVGSPAFWRVISYQRAALLPVAPGSTHILTQTLSGAVSAVDFDLLSYDFYRVTYWARNATDNQNFNLRTSSNGGSTFDSGASNYGYDTGNGAGNATLTEVPMAAAVDNTSTSLAVVGSVLVWPGDATRRCFMLTNCYYSNNSGTRVLRQLGATREATGPVNAIRFFFGSGDIAAGSFTLEGLKTS